MDDEWFFLELARVTPEGHAHARYQWCHGRAALHGAIDHAMDSETWDFCRLTRRPHPTQEPRRYVCATGQWLGTPLADTEEDAP
jgi:hypothetical protein